MDKIEWCLKTKNGLELVEPNEELTEAYLKKAEYSLRATAALKDNIDLTTVLNKKMEKNKNKYPVEKAKGSNKKYIEL